MGLALGELLEVIFRNFAMARRHIADQVLQGLGPLLFRHLAPLLCQALELLGIDVAGAAIGCDVAILHRRAGVGAAAVARLAAVGATAAVAVAASLGLVFQLLDDFVEASDDLFLNLLGLRAAAGKLQPALHVIHLAGHGAE